MKKIIQTKNAPQAVGPYSQAILSESFVFTSGQIPIDPQTNQVVKGDVQAQTKQVMENLQAVLKEAGSDFSKVIKATVYLDDIKNFQLFNEIYARYFPENPPARSAFQVAALPLAVKVEVEMIAHI